LIGSTRQVRVFAYGAPVDMRKAYDALAFLVREHLRRDPLSGDIFLFVGKTRRRAKALFWDGTGLCLFSKRLETGLFAAPWARPQDGAPLCWTTSELALFFEGSDLVGRVPLSPAPYAPADRVVSFR
jgi:transposase